MKRLTVQIEETLLWKLLQFFDFQQSESDIENISETGMESNRYGYQQKSADFKSICGTGLNCSDHLRV